MTMFLGVFQFEKMHRGEATVQIQAKALHCRITMIFITALDLGSSPGREVAKLIYFGRGLR